jgi:hypothetical protein
MTPTPNVEKTVKALEKMFTTYGLPNSITTDNDRSLPASISNSIANKTE